MIKINSEYTIPHWLKKLQENSWELEILISGGAIFSLFQLSAKFVDFIYIIQSTSMIPGMSVFILLGICGIKLLTIGFAFHLILRTLWLGFVCVNYVFPKGISEGKNKLKFPFKNKYSIEDGLFNEIVFIDRAAGLIMFFSILSTIVMAGFFLLFFVIISIPAIFFNLNSIYFSTVTGLFLIYIVDFLFYGILRKVKGLSVLLFPFFTLFDWITFRFLYRKSLILFNSNIKVWKSILIFLIMFIPSLFFSYTTIYRVMHFPYFLDARVNITNLAPMHKGMVYFNYLDKLEEAGKDMSVPTIPSRIIQSNFLELYVPYRKRHDRFIEKGSLFSDIVIVKVDDSIVDGIQWYNYYESEDYQIGIYTMLDISTFNNGPHELYVGYKNDSLSNNRIPFWKDLN